MMNGGYMKTVKIMLAALCAACLLVPLFSCKKERSAVGVTIEVFDRGTDGGKTDPKNNEWTKWIGEGTCGFQVFS
jgi:hypothetical protein